MTEAYSPPARILASNAFPDSVHTAMDACVKWVDTASPDRSGLDFEVDLVFGVINLAVQLQPAEGHPVYVKPEKTAITNLLLQDEEIRKAVQHAAKVQEYQLIRNLAVFRSGYSPPEPVPDVREGEGAEATLTSWSQDYVGKVPDALYSTMEAHCRVSQSEASDKYACFTSIVQSSGMGKSRAVDELSKRLFVIPINLKSPDATGFPPSDEEPRTFLSAPFNQGEKPYQRALAFLTALFTTTLQYLNRIDDHVAKATPGKSKNLTTDALKFRFLMTYGQSFTQPNKFRRYFFREVMKRARELMKETLVAAGTEQEKNKKRQIEGTSMEGGKKRLKLQTKEIPTEEQQDVPMEDEQDAPTDEKKKNTTAGSSDDQEPPTPTAEFFQKGDAKEILQESAMALVYKLSQHIQQHTDVIAVLAFDEAHILNARTQPEHESAYAGLRRALRALRKQPIFTIFLSTTGKIRDFVPPSKEDSSTRLINKKLTLFPPFIELGFDQIARKTGIAKKGADIEEMASPGSMAMFGRPLFGSRYLYGRQDDKEDIITFAAAKLSCSWSKQNDAVILACMAVRLALEFNSSTTEVQEIEKQQVEKHLRVCMLVQDGFERVITVAPSEPLLAEASRRLMLQEYKFDMPSSLLKVLEIPGMDKGNRGELTAEVILLKAYDAAFASTEAKAAGKPQTRHSPGGRTRAVKLLTFIQSLLALGNDKDGNGVDLSKIYPTKARTPTEHKSSFAKTFSDSWVYFNHFIKLEEGAVMNREFLWRLILRGAWVMCANNQQGSDIIGIFLIKGKKIVPENVSVFALQIKNDGTFTLDPKHWLFDAMNPFWLRILNEGMKGKPPPIIRMVFALASPEAGVSFISANEREFLFKRDAKDKAALKIAKRRSPAYTAFDIWCAGASHKTFKVIEEDEEARYAELLKTKKTFPAAYEKGAESDPLRQNLRKQMNPGTATDIEHWRYLFESDLPRKVDVPVATYHYEDDEMDVE